MHTHNEIRIVHAHVSSRAVMCLPVGKVPTRCAATCVTLAMNSGSKSLHAARSCATACHRASHLAAAVLSFASSQWRLPNWRWPRPGRFGQCLVCAAVGAELALLRSDCNRPKLIDVCAEPLPKGPCCDPMRHFRCSSALKCMPLPMSDCQCDANAKQRRQTRLTSTRPNMDSDGADMDRRSRRKFKPEIANTAKHCCVDESACVRKATLGQTRSLVLLVVERFLARATDERHKKQQRARSRNARGRALLDSRRKEARVAARTLTRCFRVSAWPLGEFTLDVKRTRARPPRPRPARRRRNRRRPLPGERR